MSGRRIDDHSAWMGGMSKKSILAQGVHEKSEPDVEGAGHVGKEYPDTAEAIAREQKSGVAKAHRYANKMDKRN